MTKIQYQIKAQDGDDAFVVQVFAAAANQFGLVDTLVTSRVENTLCNYSEDWGAGFGIASRRHADLIFADFNPLTGRTEKFEAVLDFIVSRLKAHFGERMVQADDQTYIAVVGTLPITDASRAFTKLVRQKRQEKLANEGKKPE